ncbi:hypothetical protein PTKIN_Ptkin04bG0054600 [Pterospermum kingtungense]
MAWLLWTSVNIWPRVVWKPPEEGVFKVNFDSAIRLQEKRGSIGVVIRNSMGEVMGCLVVAVQGVVDPRLIEAVVAVRAVEFARGMGFTVIELEGDSMGL